MLTKVSPAVEQVHRHRNAIINGDFDVWQRGTSQTNTGYSSDDRWRNVILGSTHLVTRETFALGQTDVPNNPKYYSRTVATSVAASTNYVTKRQKIEYVKTFADETITASFWAKADSSKNIATEFRQDFGTGGSPSASVLSIGVTTHTLTTSWQKFTVTTTIPSISGKTLGTNEEGDFQFMFWFEAGSDFDARTNSLGQQSGTFDIAQVQVEKGNQATEFEYRSIGEELALCQRYFEKTYSMDVPSGTITDDGIIEFRQDRASSTDVNSNHPTADIPFVVTKRDTPTMIAYNNVNGDSGTIRDTSAGANRGVNSFNGVGANGVGAIDTNNSYDSNTRYTMHWTADAEI